MKTIWRFPLKLKDVNYVAMPKGAEILSVQIRGKGFFDRTICIWAIVDNQNTEECQ